jgi:hypothetical protein
VALTGFYYELAAIVLADPAGNGAAAVAVAQSVENDLADPLERFTELRPAVVPRFILSGLVTHCAATLSCL